MEKYLRRMLSMLLAFVMVCTACLAGYSTEAYAAAKTPTQITLNKKSASMSVGDTLTLKVKTVKPSGASKNVTWKTSDKKVATVSSKGKVEAKKKGTVTITAVSKSNSKVTAKCKIKVNKAAKPTKITLNEKNTSMSVGDTLTLKVKAVKPAKASKNVTWKTSNKKVATVSSKGKVTAKKDGTVTITAKSKSNSKVTAKCKIKVYKATKTLKLNNTKESYTLTVGQTQKLSAKVTNPKKGAAPVTWSSGNSKVAKVNSSGKVTAVAKGKATITGKSGKKKVTVKITVKESGTPEDSNPGTPEDSESSTITRAQWVAMLVDKMGYTIDKESLNIDEASGEILYEYDDIADHTYAEKIETAYCYGIIPAVDLEDGKEHLFEPDDLVIREFAAYTTVHALGFTGEEALSSTDANQLSYPEEDKLAVDLEMLSLKNGAFRPADVLTKGEAAQIEAVIDSVLAGREIDENHQDIIIYQENVVEETAQITDYAVTEEGIIILPYTSITAKLKKGDIFILPETEDFPVGLVIRATSVVGNAGAGSVLVTGEIPEFQEVFSSIDIEGISNELAGNIELGEGVTLLGADSPMPIKESSEVEIGKSGFAVSLALDDLGASKAGKLTLSLEIPEVKYDLKKNDKIGGLENLEGLYLEIPNTVATDISVGDDFDLSDKSKSWNLDKQLAKIPIKLPCFFSVDIVAKLVANVEGNIEVEFSLDNSFGFQFYHGELFLIKNVESSIKGCVEVTAKAGMDLQLQLKWLDIGKESKPIYNLGTQIGIALRGQVSVRETGLICNDGTRWLYWDIMAGADSLLGELFEKVILSTLHIYDENNSPWKCNRHYEREWDEDDFRTVDECTYGKLLHRGTYRGMDWAIYEVEDEDEGGRLEIGGKYNETAGDGDEPTWLEYSGEFRKVTVTATNVKSTKSWFKECHRLKQVDFSNFDTSQVTDMSYMFSWCRGLESLDLKELDTSQVTNMSYMFEWCDRLKQVALSNFDTSRVTDMSHMFYECRSLTNLDLKGFDTSKVTDMSYMFYYCDSMESLDLSGKFDTGQVTNMDSMFSWCESLENLDLSSFDTSQVTNMEAMFVSCSSLESLDLSGFDMGQVKKASGMFATCKSLTRIEVPLNLQVGCDIVVRAGCIWKDASGNIYYDLPRNVTSSFTITSEQI